MTTTTYIHVYTYIYRMQLFIFSCLLCLLYVIPTSKVFWCHLKYDSLEIVQ